MKARHAKDARVTRGQKGEKTEREAGRMKNEANDG